MEMTPEKKAYFKAHGYLKIEGVIPEPMVAQAVKKINHQLGSEGMIPGGDYPLTLYNGYYSHKNHPDPFYASLVNETPIFEMAESLMEKGKLRPVGSGQNRIAISQDGRPGVGNAIGTHRRDGW